MIETAFRDRCQAEDPETYVLAWLALARARVDAPFAAAALKDRLARLRIGALSPRQRRILELLAFIARHRRDRPPSSLLDVKSLSKKGMS